MKVKMMVMVMFAMVIFSTSSFAEVFTVNTELNCIEYRRFIANLMVDYGESPVFEGNGDKTDTVLFVNVQTQSWTVIKVDKEKRVACILSMGEGFSKK